MNLATRVSTTPTVLVLLLTLLAWGLAPLTPPAAHAQDVLVIEVTTTDDLALGDASTACPAEGDDDCSLRAAIETVSDGIAEDEATIEVPVGTYGLDHADGTILLTADVPVTIVGTDAAEPERDDDGMVEAASTAIIDGEDLGDRILEVETTDLTLARLTVRNGEPDGQGAGGALFSPEAGGDLEVVDSRIEHNTSNFGAGAIRWRGTVTIERSYVGHNEQTSTGLFGGAATTDDTGDGFVIVDSVIEHNTSAERGGALATFGSAPITVTDSRIDDNIAGEEGGALYATVITLEGDTSLGRNEAGTDGGALGSISSNADFQLGEGVLLHDNHADGRGGAVYSRAGDLTVDGATLRDNTATTGGGALATEDGDITVENGALLEGNEAGTGTTRGGAIKADGSDATGSPQVTVRDSHLRGNIAHGDGGALYVRDGALTVEDSLFDGDNRSMSNRGGAITLRNSQGSVTNTTIAGNQAGIGGSAITVRNSGHLELARSTLQHNHTTGTTGGAVAVISNGSLEMTNSTISGNTADGTASGIYTSGSTVEADIASSTIASNEYAAEGGAGGIHATNSSSVTLENSIVAGNHGPQCGAATGGSITSAGHNLDDDDSCGLVATGDIAEGDAALGALIDNGGPTLTHALSLGSDARDAGDTDLTEDQRGVSRPQGADPDIGAVEMEPVDPGAITGTVTNATGSGIQDATVTAQGPAVGDDTTDGDGDYTIDDLLPGTYTVTASADGFRDATVEDVEVDADETTTLDLTLMSENCDWEWTGAESSAWEDPDNWAGPTGQVPGQPTDVVCIDEDANLPVVYDEGQGNDITIGQLSNSEAIDAIGLRIESGSLTLAEASDLPHIGIQLGDDGSFGEPTLIVEESLDVRSPSAWPRGTLGGAGMTTFHDDLAGGPDPRTRLLDGHDLVLTAHTRMGTPDLFVENGSTITNTGTLEFDGSGSMRSQSPLANLLDNHGTVLKTGSGTASTNVEFDNADNATVHAEQGRFILEAEGQNDGNFVVDIDATIEFAGSVVGRRYVHTAGSSVTGDGTIASTHTSGFEVDGAYDVATTSLVAPTFFRQSYAKFHNDDATTDELIVQFSRPRGPGTLTVTGDVTYLGLDTRESLTIDAAGDLLLSSDRNKWFYDDSLVLIAGEATHDEGDVRIRESEIDVTGPYAHTGDDLELDAGTLRTLLLDVGTDSILSGLGEVDGDVESAGTIAPGLSAFRGGPGAITVTGDLTLAGDGELQIDLEGTDDGEFDRVDVDGDATIAGTLTVELGEEFTPEVGDEFVIVTGADITGEFAVEELPQLEGEAQLQVDYRDQAVVLRFADAPTPDPEPELDPEPGPDPARPFGCDPDAADQFGDVPSAFVHRDAIGCLADLGFVVGFTDGTYGPNLDMSRGQFATVVARMIEFIADEQLDDDGPAFPDVPDHHVHAEGINKLVAAGLIRGFEDGTFRPGESLERGQAASIVDAAITLATGQQLPDGPDAFLDDDGSPHEGALNRLAQEGIVLGVGDGTVRPNDEIKRGQLASMVVRSLVTIEGLLVGEG